MILNQFLFAFFCRPARLQVPGTALFLHPANKPSNTEWYSNRPVGVNTISTVIKNICKETGAEGNFTGHSLRRTGITRMFRADVPDKLVKEVSGHRSSALDVYKVTSNKQKASVSKILQGKLTLKKLQVGLHVVDMIQIHRNSFLLLFLRNGC